MGAGFPREYYAKHKVAYLKVDELKKFYHAYHELDMIKSFNFGNANFYHTKNTTDVDMAKVRKINSSILRKKMKLIGELIG